MIIYIIYLIMINIILCFPITQHHYNPMNDNISEDINSNSIYEMISREDTLYIRTGSGLSFITYDDFNTPIFSSIISNDLPEGGSPAFWIKDNTIIISGSKAIYNNGRYRPMGTGISYSLDIGNNWNYIEQSIDPIPDSGPYVYSSWGDQDSIKFKAITIPIYNVSYDLEFFNDFIYATSFAGGLRRINYNNNSEWELIPLPMDGQDSLNCNEIDIDNYEYDPVDPPDGNDNHKAFSIFIDHLDVLWVGTGDGINKGIIDTETNCIDWFHYNEDDGMGDRWVVGIKEQITDDFNRLWAISWDPSLNTPIPHNLTYTEDSGENWNFISFFKDIEAIVYDLYFLDHEIYASTNLGLYKSYNNNLDLWFRYNIEDSNNQPSLTKTIYTSHIHHIENQNILWAGSPDGLFYSYDSGVTWIYYRSWEHMTDSSNNDRLSAYPNPFYIDEQNQYNGDGHVRIVYYNDGNNQNSKLDIFDFNMDHIISLENSTTINNEGQFLWNGRDKFYQQVSNGVYFCRLNLSGTIFWTKLMVINS